MASDLSSGCTEVNDILDDEKEEGEISLEDVSSSEEGPSYKYLPRVFGQCRYCLSMQHCATWCSSLTINKNNFKREAPCHIVAKDAGLQGKENRSNRRYQKDGLDATTISSSSGSKNVLYSSSTLQEKNDDDALIATNTNDLVPISSDSDMEVVGLMREKREKKANHRHKLRKKKRKKSPDALSLSLSPSSQDIALSIKDSIHRIEKNRLESGHSKYRHHSSDRQKFTSRSSPPLRRHKRPPVVNRPNRRRTQSPLRENSPVRSRKIEPKKPITSENESPEKKSFTKLLKKVRKLEPSNRSKEKGSSLKDKLNGIINSEKKEPIPANVEKNKEQGSSLKNNLNSTIECEKKEFNQPNAENIKESSVEPIVHDEIQVSDKLKEDVAKKHAVEEKSNDEEDEDLVLLRQIALKTKLKKNTALIKSEDIKTEPVDQPPAASIPSLESPPVLTSPHSEITPLEVLSQKSDDKTECKAENKTEIKLPNFCIDDNDEDLELRMIALRSAVIKKHRSRIANGRHKKPEAIVARIESPFTSTFIEDFPMLAEICSPASPLSPKRDILSAEDMDLDSDMELAALSGTEDQSPYSPSDDITGELIFEHDIVQPVPVTPSAETFDKNSSLYTPSKPTETPTFVAQKSTMTKDNNNLDGNTMEFCTNQESRPYSPSDATVYDPDLPGLHSSAAKSSTVGSTSLQPPPLQPPPMPPLSMFGPQQPMLLGCPPNMINTFVDPMAMAPPPMVSSFPALHQSVNPMLLPNAPSLFTYATSEPVTVPASMPQSSSLPSTSTITESNELDDFMETDLDGSPLVAIEKDGNEQRWQMLNEPLYSQNIPELTMSELRKMPTLMERNLVPAAVLKSNKQLQKQPIKKPTLPISESLFRNANMRPVALEEELDIRTTNFKPIKLQPQTKKNAIVQPAPAFNSTLDDVVDEENKPNKIKNDGEVEEKPQTSSKKKESEKSDRKRKTKKSISKQKNKELERNNKRSRTKSVSKSIIKIKKNEEMAKTNEQKRRCSIDDDEQALRESILASMVMRNKEKAATPKPPLPEQKSEPKKPVPVESISKSTDEMPLAERVSAFLAKSKEKDLKNKINPETTTASTLLKTTSTNQLKRISEPSSLSSQPIRKILKRISNVTPASKVVNNAKRYQNLLLQRKLTQQMGSAAIKSRFKLNHSRSASPVVTKSNSEFHKIIINLNEDSESESDVDEAKSKASLTKNRPLLNIPTTEFEKSVDQFLKSARQQQELASTSSAEKNNAVVSPVPMKKSLPAMDPPPANTTSVKKTVVANTTPTTAKIASKPVATKITTKLPSVTATPTAVKHLTESTQEEYRRLKQILQQRTKAKKSTSTATLAQSASEKPAAVSTSSPLSSSSSTSICLSPALVSSTPKTVTKSITLPGTAENAHMQNKSVPKIQLATTITSNTKPNADGLKTLTTTSKPVVNTTKIVHTTPGAIPNIVTLKKTTPAAINTSINKNSSVANPKSSSLTLQSIPQSSNNMFVNKQQAALLGKMNEALSSQNKQISAVVQKVSSLRILTKEKINLKTSKIQEARLNAAKNITMDDLNKTATNSQFNASKRLVVKSNKPQSTKSVDVASTPNKANNRPKKDSINPDYSKISQSAHKIKQSCIEVVNEELQIISNLTADKQKDCLLKTEESLIEKRRSVVDDITEMSLKLREWEIERDLQYKYTEEAKNLREELRKVEEKIQHQKHKLNTIHPQVSLYHKKINNGRKDCFKLSKICNSLGQQIMGSDYNVPTSGAEVLNNRIKEIVKHTQKLQNKKTQYVETVSSNNSGKTDDTQTKKITKTNNNNNNNLKKKEVAEKHSLNTKSNELASNSFRVINASKNKRSSILSDRVNKCTNEKIVVSSKFESEPMDTSTTDLNISVENITDNCCEPRSTENVNPTLNNASLETLTKKNNSKITSTSNPIVNLKFENISADLIDNELNEENKTLNIEYYEQLQETKNIILNSKHIDKLDVLKQKNVVNTISEIDPKPITQGIHFNNSDSKELIVQLSRPDKLQNASSVIITTETMSNIINSEPINLSNPTLQSVLFENNTIKTEKAETTMEYSETSVSPNENELIEIHDPILIDTAQIKELSATSDAQKIGVTTESATNNQDIQSSLNSSNNQSVNYSHEMDISTQARETNINLEAEGETSSTSGNSRNTTNPSLLNATSVPKSSEDIKTKIMQKKKFRNVKSGLKKKASKTQQRKIYYKMMQHLKEADIERKSVEDPQKTGIQPYESVLKPLRAPRNGNNANGFMCPYEMQGTCNDRDCKYVHGPLR